MSLRHRLARFFLKGYTFTPIEPGAGSIPNTRINYAGRVGDGLASSVVMSPIKFVQRTFPEAFLELAFQHLLPISANAELWPLSLSKK